MAQLTLTLAAGTHQGAQLRRLSKAIQKAASACPDNVPGQAVVLTIDSAPSSGVCSVQITGGPYQNPGPVLV